MLDHAEGKPIAMKRDLLLGQADSPSTAQFKNGGAFTKVTRVHPSHGNVDTELVPSDAMQLGIEKGDRFTVRFADKEYRVPLGSNYGDVARGKWIAFFTIDGFLKIARNYASAAELLGCKEGDKVLIKK